MAKTGVQNLLMEGLGKALIPQPCLLVIFGGTGDLARRKLIPALYNLSLDGLLPAHFAVIGFARSKGEDGWFRAVAREGIQQFSRRSLDPDRWLDFERTLFYSSGSYDDSDAYVQLRERCEKIESELGIPRNRIFYLAIPPSFIETCAKRLKAAGMVAPPEESASFSRIIIEKPVGRDLESACRVNETLSAIFDERQIFRIDHYLGKETVQNLLVLRFANSIFEPLWNQKHIDHIQITVAEQEGIGSRAGYYEEAGALRDMVQNHILQLLCLIAIEPPRMLDADVIRDAKLEVLRALKPITGRDVERSVIRAQYGAGYIHGDEVPGYRREKDVKPDSTTETHVALKLHIDNWRWAGVPFYVRTGKRMPKRVTEIAVQFKDVPQVLFNADLANPLDANVLALRIQPEEGMSLRISSKLPGPKVRVYPVKMDFHYGSTFGADSPEAYERLLLDVMAGDATLFMRRDSVEASWAWVTPILEAWQEGASRWLPEYPAGTWGPLEADKLIHADNRRWRIL